MRYELLANYESLRTEGGQNRLGILLIILIIVSSVYVGYQVLPFYYYYHELRGHMQAQAVKAKDFSDAQIRENLMRTIRKMEIPIEDPDDLKINRANGKIYISLEYEEVLYLDLGEDRVYDLWVFPFSAEVDHYLD